MSASEGTGGDVLVIGGGLAGLSTALELARRGAKVRSSPQGESMSCSPLVLEPVIAVFTVIFVIVITITSNGAASPFPLPPHLTTRARLT
jgi:hypothetical protein